MGCGIVRPVVSVNAADLAGKSLPHDIAPSSSQTGSTVPDAVATALGLLLNCVPPHPRDAGGQLGSLYFSSTSFEVDCLPPFSSPPSLPTT